ncbi:TPA: hypothetical protein ACN78K_002217 [Enterobacter hormaechei]
MDHLLRHQHRHRHADNQGAESFDLHGVLQRDLLPVVGFCHPPGYIGLKAARTPLFEFAHHNPYPVMAIS